MSEAEATAASSGAAASSVAQRRWQAALQAEIRALRQRAWELEQERLRRLLLQELQVLRATLQARDEEVKQLRETLERSPKDTKEPEPSPPRHNTDLSKLLSHLLRHKATELGVHITAHGWVRLEHAIEQVNGDALRALAVRDLNIDFAHLKIYTDNDVRAQVALDDKQRYELSCEPGEPPLIRAAQGHTIAGVATEIGAPLTLETAPTVAVHGSYLEKLEPILANGLSRMTRHHIHLAKGLLGETGVVSSLRRTCDVFVWVNVREAIKSGLRFFQSANEVILSDGRAADGCIPPEFFSVVIELRGGLQLGAAQVRLIERLFSGCSRVSVTKLYGGFSGSVVLHVNSYNKAGMLEEPTVAKLDDGKAIVQETKRTRDVAAVVGAQAVKVMRGPLFLQPNGEEKEASIEALLTADEKIDAPLRECLLDGTIRLLRCRWLAATEEADAWLDRDWTGNVVMVRRQDLPDAAFFAPSEAAQLLDRKDRSILVLSHCWSVAARPDPLGTTLRAVRRYISSDSTAAECGLFWEYATQATSLLTIL